MNKIKLFASVASCSAIMFASGCASIMSGGTQELTFKSDPEGAIVSVGGKQLGKTPLTTKIDRTSKRQMVTFAKEGFQTEDVPIDSKMNGWFLGNLLCGGAFGSTTDSASGAMHEYTPTYFNVTLKTLKSSAVPSPRVEAKAFIVSNFRGIFEELQTKPGENLASLWTILNITAAKQPEALTKLKSLSGNPVDIVDFAEKAVAILS